MTIGSMDGNDPENTRIIHGTPYPTDTQPNANDPNTWSWAVLNRSGVALLGNNPIQGNTPFQFQDRTAFSPLPTNLFSQEGAFITLLLLRLIKDKPEIFERIANRYMDNVTKIITTIVDAGKTHPLNSLNCTTFAAAVAHRTGLLDNGGYIKTIDQTRSVIDKLINIDWANMGLHGLETFVEGATGFRTAEATETAALFKALSGGK